MGPLLIRCDNGVLRHSLAQHTQPTYKTVGVSTCQQPLAGTTHDALIIASDVIDDVTSGRWRRLGVVADCGRSAEVDAERTHALYGRRCISIGTSSSSRDRRGIESRAPVTGCDVTRPVVLLARRVAYRQTTNNIAQEPLFTMLHGGRKIINTGPKTAVFINVVRDTGFRLRYVVCIVRRRNDNGA